MLQRRKAISSRADGGEMAGRLVAIEAIMVTVARHVLADASHETKSQFAKEAMTSTSSLAAEFKHAVTEAHATHFLGRLLDDILFDRVDRTASAAPPKTQPALPAPAPETSAAVSA
jgi:hypothetical protein